MPTLFDEWVRLNEEFMKMDGLKIVASAGVYTSRTRVSLHAKGFGLPSDLVLLRDARVRLLQDRYIEPTTWDRCYERYRTQPKGASHTFLFNRQGNRPKAGGCLLSIVLAKATGGYEVMVTSRAIESTMAMLADIAFVRYVLGKIREDLGVDLVLEQLDISWHVGVMHQNRVFVPVFYYEVYGASGLRRWLKSKPRNRWEQVCIDHSKNMILGKGVTGARALWGKRLKEWCYAGQKNINFD
jgi:hypothetical protein